jgi:AspBHI-like restriction endonuclease/restriction endonuclease
LKTVPFDELQSSDLHVDACYEGGRIGNAGDAPLPRLLRVDNMGGFRKRGKAAGKLEMLVLTSSMDDPDWPDSLDREAGIFTYYGDNKKPGRELHDTGRDGNLILQRIFTGVRSGAEGRAQVPPIFLFAGSGSGRNVIFLGLAVPGVSDLDASEELVAIWRTSAGSRFQNYRAKFTVLDAAVISRAWISTIIAGARDDSLAPEAWRIWVKTGRRRPLLATRSLEYRTRSEQVPHDKDGGAIIEVIRNHFKDRPHGFEHCATAIARLMMPDIATLDVTRPSRDGGRDAVGQMRVGTGPSAIVVDFALEAKCYSPPQAVGVRDMSRLISRLRHRQFGVLVTTTCVDLQAYKEIKEDQHPIVVISAADIVELLRKNGRGSVSAVAAWLAEEFPSTVDLMI